MTRMSIRVVATVGVILSTWACASSHPFDRMLSEHRWGEAAQLFASDSTLIHDEDALYSAAVLFSSPSRTVYDPERSQVLFHRLLTTFPDSKYGADATDRVALLEVAMHARTSTVRVRELEARIAELIAQQDRLRATRDSAQAQSDALRRSTTRLEADLHDRDEQLRALRLELRQLKEIDLKPRSGARRAP